MAQRHPSDGCTDAAPRPAGTEVRRRHRRRERLAEFHIDKLTIAILILIKPIETLLGTTPGALNVPHPLSLTYFAIAVGLAVMLRSSRTSLPKIRATNVR